MDSPTAPDRESVGPELRTRDHRAPGGSTPPSRHRRRQPARPRRAYGKDWELRHRPARGGTVGEGCLLLLALVLVGGPGGVRSGDRRGRRDRFGGQNDRGSDAPLRPPQLIPAIPTLATPVDPLRGRTKDPGVRPFSRTRSVRSPWMGLSSPRWLFLRSRPEVWSPTSSRAPRSTSRSSNSWVRSGVAYLRCQRPTAPGSGIASSHASTGRRSNSPTSSRGMSTSDADRMAPPGSSPVNLEGGGLEGGPKLAEAPPGRSAP